MPDFTIITPVLNQVSHIETCILSVLEQEVDIQFIIMDGGSTDGTIDIIRKYESHISYWESKADKGQSHAINKGVKLAKGTFFNWLNADDQLTPNALKTVLEAASEQTHIVVGKCEHIDDNGKQIALGGAKIWHSLEATLGNYSMGQPSLFYRTSVIEALGGLNENLHYCMDMDLWFRYLTKFGQDKIVLTESILSQFLVHSDSKSLGFKQEMSNEKYGIYEVLLSQFELPKTLQNFLSPFSLELVKPNAYHRNLNQQKLFANFCWHLMISSYQNNELDECRAYFDIVTNGNRLTETEKLKWKARLASKQFLG